MLTFDIITIFPGFFEGPLNTSLLKKACNKALLKINIFNLRDFTKDRHKTVDDRIYGGGPGMAFMPEPLFCAVEKILGIKNFSKKKLKKGTRIILTSAKGEKFNTKIAQELANEKEIIIICGRYEGVDERVTENLITDEISIGDYVLSGGEIASLVILEAVSRFVPGVVGKEESIINDSFMHEFLDFPVYTRPADFKGLKVPEVLVSGDHKKISEYRLKTAIKTTFLNRPELLAKKKFTEKEKKIMEEIIKFF